MKSHCGKVWKLQRGGRPPPRSVFACMRFRVMLQFTLPPVFPFSFLGPTVSIRTSALLLALFAVGPAQAADTADTAALKKLLAAAATKDTTPAQLAVLAD